MENDENHISIQFIGLRLAVNSNNNNCLVLKLDRNTSHCHIERNTFRFAPRTKRPFQQNKEETTADIIIVNKQLIKS